VPHEVVIWGAGNFEKKQLLADLQAIVETEAKLFGGLPFERYLFIILLSDKGRGGLEHKASTTLLYPRFGFRPKKSYEEFLTLAAHEYFHLWNVKRIKPRSLVPFDYGRENYTSLLWAMEGFTSYYDTLLTLRAGLLSGTRYLERQGENLTSLGQTPGRLVQSLDDASLCAWIKYYRPDENSPNSSVSYYLKGEVVALLLDLEIRARTGDARSLDDVMRLLWTRYGDEKGVPEEGIEAAASEVAGVSLSGFFAKSVHAPGELDFTPLSHVGLELRRRTKESGSDKGGTPGGKDKEPSAARGYLGAVTKAQGERTFIAHVLEGSPAQEAGLHADDELLALEGFRVEGDKLSARVEELAPGSRVSLTVFRREALRTLTATLIAKPQDTLFLARRSDATAAQKRAFQSWLGEPFDVEGGKGS
jgi:predicted metalloprotease with PDZ domain